MTRTGYFRRLLLVVNVLESLRPEIYGQLAEELQAHFSAQAEPRIRESFIEAIELWESEDFSRYSNGELSCTIRLYDCFDRLLRSEPRRFPMMRIQYDGPCPTREMREGREDPSRSPRPDLTVFVGNAAVHVEAKRLHLDDGLPALYVSEGMMRFIENKYSASLLIPGVMIGYVLRGDPLDVISSINAHISADSRMGPSDLVREIESPLWCITLCESVHGGEVRLIHGEIDLRS